MKILKNPIASFLILTCMLFAACNSSKEKSSNPTVTLADSLKNDTTLCSICRDTMRVKSKSDSVACNLYCGNWQNTNNNVVITGDGYFDLLIDGVNYHFPYVLTQHTDGWKYGASLTSSGPSGFGLQGDVMKQNPTITKVQFHFNFGSVTGPGTYIIPKMENSHPLNFVTANMNPTGSMPPDYFATATLLDFAVNNRRVKQLNGDCDETELLPASQTLIITKWGPAGTIVEGTISGTLYENLKSAFGCRDSDALPYQGSFKIKRLL